MGMVFPLFSVPLYADVPKRSMCDYDIKTHCPNTSAADRREITACLKTHESILTPACLQYLDFSENFGKVCADDFKTHCKGAGTDSGGRVNCLMQKKQALSPACKKQVDRFSKPAP
ncbi:MAG: hypothetical protein L0Y32_06240 [Nevskiales bacterium]|nr:hypothetical protein [Nevskiales bacterium]